MSKRIKDTDYLFLSTRTRVLEQTMLTRERMERMLDADTNAEAARVLVECGYPELRQVDAQSVDTALAAARDNIFADLYALAPDPKIIDVFKVKYDYHNAKVLLKAEAMELDPARLLVKVGRYAPEELTERVREGKLAGLSECFAGAVAEAREVLGATRDPQQCDFVLDRAYFQEMEQLAAESGSRFLEGYVRRMVDIANLKAVVRVLRMKKSPDFLKAALFSGGSIPPDALLRMAEGGGKLERVYGSTELAAAAAEGQQALSGAGLTAFERACDNALMAYVAGARYIPFGDAVPIAYLAARESEWTAVRIIMMGRLAGLKPELIRERLRDAYV